jgi:GT2 family glycosyltransferase
MQRPGATVVILAWNAWPATEACLDSLRPTLAEDDQVVVVDNGSADETAQRLPGYDWIELHTNPENRGFAAGCNQGAAAARNPVVVFLNNDTVVSAGWLDGLLDPFADASVAATGPRSNFVSGTQLIDTPYEVNSRIDIDDFAWLWRLNHAGSRTETTRLVGFCLAVRTDAFRAIGGFDEGFGIGGCEDDDLCLRLRTAGGTLLVTDDVFVHHEGHATFDANAVDWFAVQTQNMARLHQRHAGRPALPWPEPMPPRDTGSHTPRVSVLVPTHNRLQLLRRTLESIAAQTFSDVEAVVVNDGGPDVGAVVASMKGRLAVTLVTHPVNRGRAGACNSAVLAARGELLAFLDDDDTYFPHHLATLVGAWDEANAAAGEQPVGVHSYCIRVEEVGGRVASRTVLGDREFDPEILAVTNTIVGMTPLVPADEVRAAGGFDERMRVLEDWELWLRLCRRGLRFTTVPVPTAEYHWHADNQTVRELTRFHDGVLHTYGQHPVLAGTPAAAHRAEFISNSAGRQAAYAFDVSVVVACADDLPGLVRTLHSAAAVLAGGRWELVLCVPAPDRYQVIVDQLEGDLQIYAVGATPVEQVWELASTRTAGRHVLRVREGQALDSGLVLSVLGGPDGNAAEVGELPPGLPAPRAASEPIRTIS